MVIRKQLVTADNMGYSFRKNNREKKYEVNPTELVDNISTFVRDNKIKATSTTFITLDLQHLNHVDLNKLRVIGSYGDYEWQINVRIQNHIGAIRMDMGSFNINYAKTKFRNDTNGNLYDVISSLQINGDFDMWLEANNLPTRTHHNGYMTSEYRPFGVDWNFDKLEQTIFISYGDNTNKKYYKLYRKSTGLARGSYYPNVDPRYAIDPSVQGTAYQTLNATNLNLNLNWTNWHVENLDSAPITTQPPVEYTASNGVKKVGNDFQLNAVDSSLNGIKKLDDGSIYVPTSARVLTVRNTTAMMGEVNTDKPFIGISSIVTYTPNPAHIKPSSATQYEVNIDARVSNVKVSYYFKTGNFDGNEVTGLGHEHIKNISLMPSTIRATNNPIADTNINSYLFANNLNSRIRDFTYSDGKVSFTVPDVYSYLPAEVQFVIELKDSVKSIGSGNTLKFTGFVMVEYTDPTEVEGLLATYKRDINFNLVGNGS